MSADPDPRSLISLPALLAGLLPGDSLWPCAADLDLSDDICRLAQSWSPYASALERLEARGLPPRNDPEALEQALMDLQASEPAVFSSLMLLAYGAYYAHPAVLSVIERQSGYPARPPMPTGHPVMLQGPDRTPATAGGEPTWRLDGTSIAERVQGLQKTQPSREWTLEEIWSWPMS